MAKKSLPSRTLADLGEDRVVARLTQKLALGEDVRIGAGDDCAVIGRPRDARWQLLKTDVVIEGVHFLAGEDPRRVGWKALCRALSDIAAMGGVPAHALVTLAAPPATPVTRMEALYVGLSKAARRFGVSIVGGETSRSPGPLFINVALTGWVERARCVLRSGGQPGDALYVTGRLGGSRAGKHLDFTPRLAEARWLVSNFKPHAMMDLSDGLAADLPHLAAASRCVYEILSESENFKHRTSNSERRSKTAVHPPATSVIAPSTFGVRRSTFDVSPLPITPGCTREQALTDGEDYELLFALAPRAAPRLQSAWGKAFPRLPLTRIGALNSECKIQNAKFPSTRGFDHFA